ncbi:MAG TPA: hypothetical protein VMF07_03195, partial [Solirubrobacteraceae bacterium]|nr:hypothetical protein [Solirubrobacteraceae bacterium]
MIAIALAALAVALGFGPPAGRTTAARAAAVGVPTGADAVQPELGLPATQVMVFGASSQTPNAGEVWATGHVGDFPLTLSGGSTTSDGSVLLEHTNAGGWQGVSVDGGPLPAKPPFGAQSGRATPDGGVALWVLSPLTGPSLVTVNAGATTGQTVALPQPGSAVLDASETIVPTSFGAQTIPFAAVDDASGQTGVLVAPQNDGEGTLPAGVLDY